MLQSTTIRGSVRRAVGRWVRYAFSFSAVSACFGAPRGQYWLLLYTIIRLLEPDFHFISRFSRIHNQRFHRRFPDLMANVETNRHRLVTHFDTHKTLLHLLHLQTNSTHSWSNKVDGLSPIGVSVLTDEIPANRTCQEAGIAIKFCSCELIHHVIVDPQSDEALNIANIYVRRINEFLKPATHLCQPVSLDGIVTVTKNPELSRVYNGSKLYEIDTRVQFKDIYIHLFPMSSGASE